MSQLHLNKNDEIDPKPIAVKPSLHSAKSPFFKFAAVIVVLVQTS